MSLASWLSGVVKFVSGDHSAASSSSSSSRSSPSASKKRAKPRKLVPGELSAPELARLYLSVLQCKRDSAQLDVQDVLSQLYTHTRATNPSIFESETDGGGQDEDAFPSECQVCYSTFSHAADEQASADNDDEGGFVDAMVMLECNHAVTCTNCVAEHVRVRVRDNDVLPWIPCSHHSCRIPITPFDLSACGAEDEVLLGMARTVLAKTLVRDDDWVECSNDDCPFGYCASEAREDGALKCAFCGVSTERKEEKDEKADEELQKLIANGTVRGCPKCGNLMVKDKGLCNVVQCTKCSIWWNWRTRETGSSSRALKQKARSSGSLWEPGELEYQRRLERTDLNAFKALLAQNGIEYDPNYVRGQG